MKQVPSLYGVVELDANLKNTIESLEKAKHELKKLTSLDLDYKMPGLAAFRKDAEHMIKMLHNVEHKVAEALDDRQNESQIVMNEDGDFRSHATTVPVSKPSTKSRQSHTDKKKRKSKTDRVSHYDVELKIKMIPK